MSVVQTLESLQTTAVPPQTPEVHLSAEVQALPSLQVPVLLVNLQPVLVLQVSVVQALLSLQTTAAPAVQEPAAQTSPEVQALPSSQVTVLLV